MELNKAMLDCMRALRRQLRIERGLDIHLDRPDAVAAMLAASREHASPTLQAIGQRLAELCDPPSTAPPDHAEAARPQRVYRGNPLPDSTAADSPPAERLTRTYRGQTIHGET